MLRHKFNAVRTEYDGHSFPSKAEADYYLYLKDEQRSGDVIGFLMQVPLHFPGGGKYVCDFLVFYDDGSAKFVEVKGRETESYKAKRRLVAALYPWADIEIVRA